MRQAASANYLITEDTYNRETEKKTLNLVLQHNIKSNLYKISCSYKIVHDVILFHDFLNKSY